MADEKEIWDIYNTIREVESTFRCLKSDLRLRPVYHQKDFASEAHLHLGLLVYQIVSAVRYMLKTREYKLRLGKYRQNHEHTKSRNSINHKQEKRADNHKKLYPIDSRGLRKIQGIEDELAPFQA